LLHLLGLLSSYFNNKFVFSPKSQLKDSLLTRRFEVRTALGACDFAHLSSPPPKYTQPPVKWQPGHFTRWPGPGI